MEKSNLKDLDIIANSDEPLDFDMNLLDYGYCAKVRKLYQNYKNNQMNIEDCKKLKVKISKEYEDIVEYITHSSRVWLEHQENIKKSEILRAEVNKSTDLQEMLLKSLEIVSLLTGDETFYKINAEKVNKND